MRLQPLRLLALFVGGALLAGLPGCGPSRTEVTGQIKYNGKPIEEKGTISFLGPDGIPVSAEIDPSGNYHAVGVCVGENKVAVVYLRPGAIPEKGKAKGRVPNAPGDSAKAKGSAYLIGESFAVPETSGLTVTIEKNTVYSPELTGPIK